MKRIRSVVPVKSLIIFLSLLLFLAGVSLGIQKIVHAAMRANLFDENEGCKFPCWNDITPGKTSGELAVVKIQRIPYINKKSIQLSGDDVNGGCIWDWWTSERRIQSGIYWQNERVQEIWLDISFDITIQEVITRFGIPTTVFFSEYGIPEHWYWVINMYYAEAGMEFVAYTDELSVQIEPSTKVGTIHLYVPKSADQRIKQEFPNGYSGWIKPSWKGYGNLLKMYNIPANK